VRRAAGIYRIVGGDAFAMNPFAEPHRSLLRRYRDQDVRPRSRNRLRPRGGGASAARRSSRPAGTPSRLDVAGRDGRGPHRSRIPSRSAQIGVRTFEPSQKGGAKENRMKGTLLGACVSAGLLLSSATSAGTGRGTGNAVARGELTLDRALTLPVTFVGGADVQIPSLNDVGYAVTQVWLEPWEGCSGAEGQSTLAVRLRTGPNNERTVVFVPELFNTSSGTRSNGRDRVVGFDPPFVVRPGETLTLHPMIHDQNDQQWKPTPPGTTTFKVGVGCYRLDPGDA
jgi:hypothetical protein